MSLASRRKCDNADGSLKSRFEYADSRLPVSGTIDGTRYYFAYDQVGSLRAVADASGTVVKTVTYDSFGNVLEDTNEAFEVPFGFAGGLYDADTGLVRFGFRDYDAEVGRWTAKDPLGFGGGDSDLYGYCEGDPINWMDPEGLFIAPLGLTTDLGHPAPPSYFDSDCFIKCLFEDKLFKRAFALSPLGLLNLKSMEEIIKALSRSGKKGSIWTSIDKNWPNFPGANPGGGWKREAGKIKRGKPVGRLGAASTVASFIGTAYMIVRIIHCYARCVKTPCPNES